MFYKKHSLFVTDVREMIISSNKILSLNKMITQIKCSHKYQVYVYDAHHNIMIFFVMISVIYYNNVESWYKSSVTPLRNQAMHNVCAWANMV